MEETLRHVPAALRRCTYSSPLTPTERLALTLTYKLELHMKTQTSTSSESTRKALEGYASTRKWIQTVLELLGQLIHLLKGIIASWERFKSDDLSSISTAAISSLVQQISECMKELQDTLDLFLKMDRQYHLLRREVRNCISPHFVPSHFDMNWENHQVSTSFVGYATNTLSSWSFLSACRVVPASPSST